MSLSTIYDIISSPAAQSILALLATLLGWNKYKAKAADKIQKLEARVLDAAINAAHDVGELVQRGEVAVEQVIAKWDRRWSEALGFLGIDVSDLADELKRRANAAALKVFKELHLYAPGEAKQQLRDAAANFERAMVDINKDIARGEAAEKWWRAQAERTAQERAAKGR